MNAGIRGCNFFAQGNMSRRLIPRINMIKPIIRFRENVAEVESVNADPIAPITPPRIKKDMIRPIWNMSCGRTLLPSFANVADIESTRPPTTAIQVESDAITPIINVVL